MNKTMLRMSLFAGVAATLAGCAGKNETSSAAEDADLVPEVEVNDSICYDLFDRVNALLDAGSTNEANAAFSAALGDEAYAPFRSRLFESMIRYFVFTGQVDEARRTYLAELRTAPDNARPVRDYIYGYLLQTGDAAGALDWARAIAAQDVPDDFRVEATAWVFSGQLNSGDAAGAMKTLEDALAEFPAAAVAPLVSEAGRGFIAGGDAERAGKTIALASAAAADGDALSRVVTDLGLRLLAFERKWDELLAAFPAASVSLPEPEFRAALSVAFRAAQRADDFDALEKLSEPFVFEDAYAALGSVRRDAARQWAGAVLRRADGNPVEYPARLERLLSLQYDPVFVLQLYTGGFYRLVNDGSALVLMRGLSKKLEGVISDPDDLEQLRNCQIDAAFLLEDYDAALDLVDVSHTDKDETWHEMMKSKILAHKALKAGELDEAAAKFREFVAKLPDEEQEEPDTGVVYSRALIAGNNELRIAEFYAGAGEAEKAAEAYAAAKRNLDDALAAVREDDPTTREYVKSRLAKLEGKTK